MLPLRRIVGLAGAFAMLAGACSDDDRPASSPVPGDPASSYITEIDDVMDRVSAAIRVVDTTLGATYAEPSARFRAFDSGQLGAVLEAALEEADRLEPTAAFAGDHVVIVAALGDAVTLGSQVSEAIEQRDLVDLAVAVAKLKALQGRTTQEVSPELCEAVSPQLEEDGLDATGTELCIPVTQVGESDWERGTARTARRFFVEIIPRITGIERSFSERDTAEYLSHIQPEVELILGELADAQAALDPPRASQADHEHLVEFYFDLGSLAGRISTAAESGDAASLEELFAESGKIVDAAAASLSAESRRVIAPMFHDL